MYCINYYVSLNTLFILFQSAKWLNKYFNIERINKYDPCRQKYIYFFEEGSKDMKMLLGGKGAGLAEMTRIGLRTPPGFTITTEACNYYFNNGQLPPGLWEDVVDSMHELEKRTNRVFGGGPKILLVSVRSGAPVSMPGMMDTVLNLGLNDSNVNILANETNNERFAWDAYRRFVQMFGRIVLGVDAKKFDSLIEDLKMNKNIKNDYENPGR